MAEGGGGPGGQVGEGQSVAEHDVDGEKAAETVHAGEAGHGYNLGGNFGGGKGKLRLWQVFVGRPQYTMTPGWKG
jgi:hypothetical protein